MTETKMKPLTNPMIRLLRNMAVHGDVMVSRSWGDKRSASFLKGRISDVISVAALDGLTARGLAIFESGQRFGSGTCRLTPAGLDMVEKLGPESKQDLGKVYWVDYGGAVHSTEIESETEKTITVKGYAHVGDESYKQIPKDRVRTKICRTAREAVEEYRRIGFMRAKNLLAESLRTQAETEAAADLLGPFGCVDCGEIFDVVEGNVYLCEHLPEWAQPDGFHNWKVVHKHKDDNRFHEVVRLEEKDAGPKE